MRPLKPDSLARFLGCHAGETAWVFGKGASLDRFDFSEAGALRCAINDVAAAVPDVVYGFANDDTNDWNDVYAPLQSFVLFQPFRTALRASVPPCERVCFDDHPEDTHPVRRSAESLSVDGLTRGPGTLSSVVQILHLMGVSRIVCVGIDGNQTHATRHPWRTTLMNEHWKRYSLFRSWLMTACELYGISLTFWGSQNNKHTPNGNMIVKILSSTFCNGELLAAGDIVELNPQDAADLLAMRMAVKCVAPEPEPEPAADPELETASAEPLTEVADAPAPRQRTKKKG